MRVTEADRLEREVDMAGSDSGKMGNLRGGGGSRGGARMGERNRI